MKTLDETKKPARKIAVRKAAPKPRKPRQTRAEFIAEVKAIAARIDAGTERMYSAEEAKRELGL